MPEYKAVRDQIFPFRWWISDGHTSIAAFCSLSAADNEQNAKEYAEWMNRQIAARKRLMALVKKHGVVSLPHGGEGDDASLHLKAKNYWEAPDQGT